MTPKIPLKDFQSLFPKISTPGTYEITHIYQGGLVVSGIDSLGNPIPGKMEEIGRETVVVEVVQDENEES